MTDGGAAFQPGPGELDPPLKPRGAYVGHEVFGHGDGAVLVEPEVARDLRAAAELASQERRVAGGLLYGRGLADDEGRYLVVDGFLESGPGENRGDHVSRDGYDSFALSDADLGLLREDAARMYPAAVEVGWWRTLAGAGEFGPGTSRRSASSSAPAASACSCSGPASSGEPPTWGPAARSPARPGHSSRSRGPRPTRRRARPGAWPGAWPRARTGRGPRP